MSSLFVLPTVNSYNISCAKNHWKGSGELKDTAQKLLSNNASEILLSLKKTLPQGGTHEIHIQFHEIRLHSRLDLLKELRDGKGGDEGDDMDAEQVQSLQLVTEIIQKVGERVRGMGRSRRYWSRSWWGWKMKWKRALKRLRDSVSRKKQSPGNK